MKAAADRPALTDRQVEIVRLMAAAFASDLRWPTIRQLAAGMGVASPNGIVGHLDALIRKGVAEHVTEDGPSRGYRLVGVYELLGPVVRPLVAAHADRLVNGGDS